MPDKNDKHLSGLSRAEVKAVRALSVPEEAFDNTVRRLMGLSNNGYMWEPQAAAVRVFAPVVNWDTYRAMKARAGGHGHVAEEWLMALVARLGPPAMPSAGPVSPASGSNIAQDKPSDH
jgi:hypothetical protein